MGRAPATIAQATEMAYLKTNWNRTQLATFAQDVTITDVAGHGHDEVCPVTLRGQSFSTSEASDITPFTQSQVEGPQGVGFLVCFPRFLRRETIVPGNPPEEREDITFEVDIVTPTMVGPGVALEYAGALAKIFNRVIFSPAENGVDRIRNHGGVPKVPQFLGQAKNLSYHRLDIPLTRYGRPQPVLAP